MNVGAAWHDTECGSYRTDLPLWRELAEREDGPVLDVGAGTGRVARDLAARGHEVVALDLDADLLGELRLRAAGSAVETVAADARAFDLGDRRFGLIIVPMQTVQMLGGPDGRAGFLASASRHLAPGGALVCALADAREGQPTEEHSEPPLPDLLERDGHKFISQPVRVRVEPDSVAIDRIRTRIDPDGTPHTEGNTVALDRVSAAQLAEEAEAHGLHAEEHRRIAPSDEHVGSEVVILRA